MKPAKKILVIDDSEVSLFLIRSIFESDPAIEVSIEVHSSKALTRLIEENFELLVLDLLMPETDGFQLLMQIRATPEIQQLPVLVISAYHNLEAEQYLNELKIEGFIKKPLQLAMVKEKILEILKVAEYNASKFS